MIIISYSAASTFDTINITHYSITSNGKVLTRTTQGSWEEGVFLNTNIAQTQVYRFRLLKCGGSNLMVGVAPDTPHFTEQVFAKSFCYDPPSGRRYEKNIQTQGTQTLQGQEFTVSVDLSNKKVSFTRDGQNLVSPFSFAEYGDMQKLRPIVQMAYKDDSVEILS